EKLVETAVAVELAELGIAADRAVPDQDLRHGPAAGQVMEAGPEARIVVDPDLVVGESLRLEEGLGAHTEATPGRRIHRNRLHYYFERIKAPGHSPPAALDSTQMAGRSYQTEAIVLRSLRFGEADRILHLYTRQRGRVGAIAKGIRKTKSRVGARLEPLSHVALQLHEGSGELRTLTCVDLI